jgi:hypothetical protein
MVKRGMAREMIWVERIQGWGCSDCALVFVPSGTPLGNTMEEMKRNYETHREKEFISHDCIKQSATSPQADRLPKKTE